MLKKLFSILLPIVLMVGCASLTPAHDYTKRETHSKIFSNLEYPQMTLPTVAYEWLKNFEEESGYTHKGVFVDNAGDFVVFFENKNGDCKSLLILATRGGATYFFECDEAWNMYKEICVEQNFCTADPYVQVKI